MQRAGSTTYAMVQDFDDDEKQAKENAKADKRTARDAAIRQFVTVMVSIALGGVAALLALNNLTVTLK